MNLRPFKIDIPEREIFELKQRLSATRLPEKETVDDWPSDLENGHIHADLFPNNVFFTNNKLSGIIDFYFACYDILAYDIAICINSWCFNENGKFSQSNLEALLLGYSEIKKLKKEGNEISVLFLADGESSRKVKNIDNLTLSTLQDAFMETHIPDCMIYTISGNFNRSSVISTFKRMIKNKKPACKGGQFIDNKAYERGV